MASISTDLIVRAISEGFDKIQGELRETGETARRAGQGVEDSGKGASTAGLKWTEMLSAVTLAEQVFSAAAGAAQHAYDVLKEGAALEASEQRFGRLAESIGTTSSALSNELSGAVRGMMTDAESMALAGDLMSLGLAKTADETVRLTRVASALNMDMNQLTLTLANQTTMRFDSLGVSVDGFDERLEELKAQGLSTNEAFTEAFLQQAEAQILKVGDAADTTTGKLERLENRAKNTWDRFKLQLVESAEPTIDALLEHADALDVLDAAYKRGLISQQELLQQQRNLGVPALREATEATLAGIEAQLEAGDAAWDRAAAEDALRSSMSDGQATRQEYIQQMHELTDVHREVAEQQREGERAADDFTEALDRLRGGQGEGVLLKFTADTAPARTELDALITDYSGKTIPFEVLPTLRGRGGEHAQGEEVMRPVKEALGDIFDKAILQLQPQIEMQQILEMESTMGNIITNSEYVNTTPITPVVHDQDIQDLLTDLGLGQDALDGIVAGNDYPVNTESNVPELNAQLGETLSLIRAIEGTHTVTVNYQTTGNPHSGPYDMGGAGGQTGANGGGQGGAPQTQAPVVNFYGTSPQENVQYLQDRGILPGTLLK